MVKEEQESGKNQSSLDDFFESSVESENKQENTLPKQSTVEKSKDHAQSKENRELAATVVINSDDEDDSLEIEEDEPILMKVGTQDKPDNLPPSYLLSVDYDGAVNKAIIRLYNPEDERIYFWHDNTGHKPYCYTDFPLQKVLGNPRISRHQGFVEAKSVERYDLLRDRPIEMTKVIATDPLSIGGRPGAIREYLKEGDESHAWEAAIRYRNTYSYDSNLIPGSLYEIVNGDLKPVSPKLDKTVMKQFADKIGEEKELKEVIDEYAPMFFSEVPDIRRIALDIEVYTPVLNRIPDANTSPYPVTAVGLSDNEGFNKCFVLRRKGMQEGPKRSDFPEELDIVYFDSEADMLVETFRIIDGYPIVITFVGDAFDLNYLFHRAEKLKIDLDTYCPIRMGRDIALLDRGIHVDLYRFLKNPSIRLYALSGAYDGYDLNSIARGLLGTTKLDLSTDISKLSYNELAHYCWQDANITLQITSYNDNLLMRLIILLMRISRLSMEDVTRLGISSWIQSLFRQVHRNRGAIIPRQSDIEFLKSTEAQTEAMIKDKRFKGAIVIEPVAGVHFNTTVLDFASLYPTIMKQHNISYETVDCLHEECRLAKDNRVPETDHWICKKRTGMISQTIGFFRDTRVRWFKSKSKDKSLPEETRNWYTVVEKALKVFVNASYGVTGAAHFELFCMPAAESVTAYGRNAIIETKNKSESMGIRVLYGDTDSVFLDNPSKEQQKELIRWSSEKLGIDLEVEKTYKYVALSGRKKNYIGVYQSGYVEVKGLSGKKRNTPDFAQDAFREMLTVLSRVDNEQGFEHAKEEIRDIVNNVLDRLEEKGNQYSPEELAFRVQMTKPIDKYGDAKPMHVRAAMMLRDAGYEVPPGTIVEYIKVKGLDDILPVQVAKETSYWVDKDKYIDTLRSVFEQVLDSVGINFEELLGVTTLDQFF